MGALKDKLTSISTQILDDLEKKPLKTVLWAVLIAYLIIRIVKSIKD